MAQEWMIRAHRGLVWACYGRRDTVGRHGEVGLPVLSARSALSLGRPTAPVCPPGSRRPK
eukprot:4601310-Alexandrium_andersonii.AAC.1